MKGVLFVITSPRPHTHPAYGLIKDMMAQTTTHADRFVFADSLSCAYHELVRDVQSRTNASPGLG
jgi:hypothetical protein